MAARRWPLSSVLSTAWRVVIGLGAILLFVDVLVFYRYGLRESESAPSKGAAETVDVRTDRIKNAARLMNERRAQFENAVSIPSSLRNPF